MYTNLLLQIGFHAHVWSADVVNHQHDGWQQVELQIEIDIHVNRVNSRMVVVRIVRVLMKVAIRG